MVSDAQDLVAHTKLGVTSLDSDRTFIAGTSQAILALENVIADIAPTNIPILLVGESGAGKEMFAQHIHRLSRQRSGKLTRISCASTSAATLLEELGLHSNGDGDLQAATAGTAFFDEISELDAGCQGSLVSALPDGDVSPRRMLLKSRVIATTRKNLEDEIRAGRFRKELFYRISGICLHLPALRERKEDIPLFVEFFLEKYAAELGRPRQPLSSRALQALQEHDWPGNIRELENIIREIIVLGDEQLALARLRTRPPEAIHASSLKAVARAASRAAERELILKALGQTHWNRKRAAQELQISYKSLLYKLKEIGLRDTEANPHLR
jgi:DNA-binding NtrC family response regulator